MDERKLRAQKIKQLVAKIKRQKWRKRGKWPSPVIVYEIIGEGEATSSQKMIGHPFKRSMGVWLSSGEYFDLQKEWDWVYKTISKEYKKNKIFLSRYGESCLEAGNKVISYSKKIKKINYKKLNNKELGRRYSEFSHKCMSFMPYMFSMHLVDKLLTLEFEKKLKKFAKIKKLDDSSYFDYQNALVFPSKRIFALEERIDFLKLLIRNKKNSSKLKKYIDLHTEKYGWMNMVNWEGSPFDSEYFMKKYDKALKTNFEEEYQTLTRENSNLKKQQNILMKEIRAFPRLFELSRSIQVFGFLRSFRVDVLSVSLYNSWNLIQEIAGRLKIRPMDVRNFTSGEITLTLSGKREILKLLTKRKGGASGIIAGDELYLVGDKNIEEIKVFLLQEEKLDTNVKEIKGSTAYPGKISGICKVIHSLKEMNKVQKGEILVISMTDPNYLPAMEKAAAFVTDHGGILCHAAIVSREMKKPCVIGTKIATKVLRDGDLVEVDADRGVVRILKKN